MKPTSLALALAIAVALSFFEFGWRVELPPLPSFAPQLHAASEPDVECVEWAKAGPWTITRCEDWAAGEVCFMANSGMMDCKFEY